MCLYPVLCDRRMKEDSLRLEFTYQILSLIFIYFRFKLIFFKEVAKLWLILSIRKKRPIQSYDITVDAERGTKLDNQGAE
jgi:hypothetical protein